MTPKHPRRKHAPVGRDETPELPATPHGPPEPSRVGARAGVELPAPPPIASEHGAPVEPSQDQPPSRPPPAPSPGHVGLRRRT